MTQLRLRMLQDLKLRNLSPPSFHISAYIEEPNREKASPR